MSQISLQMIAFLAKKFKNPQTYKLITSNLFFQAGKLPSTSDPPPLPLPDLVADHEQSIRRPRPGLSSHQPDQGNNELCNAIQVPRQQFRADSSDADSDPSGLSLDLKLSIDYNYRKIGQGLRQIADQFQHDRSQVSFSSLPLNIG